VVLFLFTANEVHRMVYYYLRREKGKEKKPSHFRKELLTPITLSIKITWGKIRMFAFLLKFIHINLQRIKVSVTPVSCSWQRKFQNQENLWYFFLFFNLSL
jgi:hypothetical protein